MLAASRKKDIDPIRILPFSKNMVVNEWGEIFKERHPPSKKRNNATFRRKKGIKSLNRSTF
jgi:hypothetical protein